MHINKYEEYIASASGKGKFYPSYDIAVPEISPFVQFKQLPHFVMQSYTPSIPGASSFNERVVNIELKTWFGQGGFCALTFEGYKKSSLLYSKLTCNELVDAHHIVCQSYAKKLYHEDQYTMLNGAPILKGVHATANGFPLKRSIHESIHRKSKEPWEVTFITQQLVQKYFEENYGFLCRIPLLPGISLGERWAEYLLSKSLIYLPINKSTRSFSTDMNRYQ